MRSALRTLLMVGLSLCPLPALAAGEPARPNLLLIVTDDQGYWELGSTGNPHIDTPNLDARANLAMHDVKIHTD